MGIKYCKSCKKPMKSTESSCRTCGTEYKTSYLIPVIILLIIVSGIIGTTWWYISKKQIEKENIHKANVASYVEKLKTISIYDNDASTIANYKFDADSHLNKLEFIELKKLVTSFHDQRELSNKVMRVALAQPISELQKIKRDTEAKKYSGCLEASRLIYVSSMNLTNEAILTFLAEGSDKDYEITQLFTKSLIQEQEAKKVLEECETTIAN
ncbi:hypothetical protein F900_02108 [Acinetobacter modestus]|uniref:Uncharacterized protein n=1 Tax=Acinetobacter modestus TaxID=1776740 RepID=N9NC46_9GAMM|nr:hypothetical protein [Acinetobacter modestus]ENX00437.1 hypothetical protein F900_02108 [Acinetobacter modestus]